VIDDVLIYVAALIVALWGTMHVVFGTRGVVAGFGAISLDNRRVLTMEWVAEGLTEIFVGILLILVTARGGADDAMAIVVYRATAGFLLALALLTALTGARTPVVWFKACPFVLATAIVLLLAGSLA
jgi:hypothetical protein